MKCKTILFYQNVPNLEALIQGIDKTISLIKEHTNGELELEVDLKETNYSFTTENRNGVVFVNPWQIFSETQTAEKFLHTNYHVACLVFDESKVTGERPTNPVHNGILFDKTTVIQVPTYWFNDYTKKDIVSYPEVFTQYFLHELCHAWYFLTNTQIDPDLEDETHNVIMNNVTPTNYYLSLIKKLSPYYSKFTDGDTGVAYKLNKNLKPGDSGIEVIELQKALIELGDFYKNHSGDTKLANVYGPVTRISVERYQKRKGIMPVSGWAYEKTRTALKEDLSKKKLK